MTGAGMRRWGAVAALVMALPVTAWGARGTAEALSAPKGLKAKVVSSSEIDLTWSPPDHAAHLVGYYIYRDGERVASTSATTTSFADTGLQPSTTYQYYVTAFDDTGTEGPASNTVTATTQSDVPGAPKNLTAQAVSATEIDLAWNPPTSGGAVDHYDIYRDGTKVDSTTSMSYGDQGLSPATQYTYVVSGVSGSGEEGPFSNKVSATTESGVPGAPKDLTGQAVSATQIDLAWSPPTSGAAVGHYDVYRDGTKVDSTTSTSYSDRGLSPSTQYTYVVSAVSTTGQEGPFSNQVSATTESGVPGAPQNLAATVASASQINLAWDPPASGAAVGHYDIYRDGTKVDSTTSTSYSDQGLSPSTQYAYAVSAVSTTGQEGPFSNQVSATTGTDVPGAPTSLTATPVSSGRIDLAWNPPTSGAAVGHYDVYRDSSKVDSTSSTSYSDQGLSPATQYTYSVSAVSTQGLEGPRSKAVSARTKKGPDQSPPTAPTGLTATATSMSTVKLQWSPAQDPESGISAYVIYRDGAKVGQVDALTFTDGSLEPSTEYHYQVSAIDGAGLEGPKSDSVAVTTAADKIPPSPPTDLRVVASGP